MNIMSLIQIDFSFFFDLWIDLITLNDGHCLEVVK